MGQKMQQKESCSPPLALCDLCNLSNSQLLIFATDVTESTTCITGSCRGLKKTMLRNFAEPFPQKNGCSCYDLETHETWKKKKRKMMIELKDECRWKCTIAKRLVIDQSLCSAKAMEVCPHSLLWRFMFQDDALNPSGTRWRWNNEMLGAEKAHEQSGK